LMPDLRTLGFDVSPSDDPITYPGKLVKSSSLVAESWLYRLMPEKNLDIGRWQIVIDGGPLLESKGPGGSIEPSTVDSVLEAAGVTCMANRYPVLAVGSNASPGQLRHKFARDREVSSIVPLTRATASGMGISHSAHVSKAGYIAYVPFLQGRSSE